MEVGVVSAPVVHTDEDHKEGVGLIDTLDIMAYIVELFSDAENRHHNLFDRLQGAQLASMKIGNISDFAHNPYTPIDMSKSLYDACKLMVKTSSHRCPIVDNDGKIVSVLTQSALVGFLAKNMNATSELCRAQVGELHLGTRPVITVPKTMRAIDAFKVMHEHKSSGLGVIDSSGILIGNLSARDLKHLDANNLHSCMYTSASSFIQRVRANMINIAHPAISCTDETELGFVIGRLATNRIHRLYICDRELRPVGVISLRDVLGCVLDRIDTNTNTNESSSSSQS